MLFTDSADSDLTLMAICKSLAGVNHYVIIAAAAAYKKSPAMAELAAHESITD